MDLKNSTVGQIAINADDIDRATAFYRDVLGFTYLFSIPTGAFFDCGGVRLFVDRPTDERFDHRSSIVYFNVEDIHGTAATLKGRGVVFEQDPQLLAKMDDHELWMAFFDDSEGNVLALMSEIR